ncbi:hypothetical protein DXA38_03920 [[Clostridium] innocuum]|uniref:Uncharacterized protein n=1 Tax=Clostridium innocuum TaxID=1522 RepID=A0A3E2W306_CLOIN|nr:hypothetical protein DXA38_03920 [[Clostridium] innocuum]RHV62295.1 hypothetical protein DXB22_15820 [Clostridiaceae bacterium OM02-2AC]
MYKENRGKVRKQQERGRKSIEGRNIKEAQEKTVCFPIYKGICALQGCRLKDNKRKSVDKPFEYYIMKIR